jgi:hypothetical protein
MDIIILNRVKEFLAEFKSGDYERISKALNELEDFLERLISITRDKNTLSLALALYMQIPLYREILRLKSEISKLSERADEIEDKL